MKPRSFIAFDDQWLTMNSNEQWTLPLSSICKCQKPQIIFQRSCKLCAIDTDLSFYWQNMEQKYECMLTTRLTNQIGPRVKIDFCVIFTAFEGFSFTINLKRFYWNLFLFPIFFSILVFFGSFVCFMIF